MNTFSKITTVSTILATAVLCGLAPAAAEEFTQDCSAALPGPISALVWNMDSETWVARVVSISTVAAVPAVFKVAAPAQVNFGFDPNIAYDESLIGAGSVGVTKSLSIDPES